MNRTPFSICLNSIHLPGNEDDKAIWDSLSLESRNYISSLYSELNRKMVTSSRIHAISDLIRDSVFGLCIREGYVIIMSTPNAAKGTVTLDGFLLKNEESLRTAWRTVRWQLLFLCAAGWREHGSVWLEPNEIISRAETFRAPVELQKKLVETGSMLINSPCPVNFAMTGCIRSMLPLNFENSMGEALHNEPQFANDSIIIDPAELNSSRRKVYAEYENISGLKIFCTSVRNYVKLKLAEARSSEEEKAVKKNMKSEFEGNQNDKIWCIRVTRAEKIYTDKITEYTSDGLSRGNVVYNRLVLSVSTAVKNAVRFFDPPVVKQEPVLMPTMESVNSEKYIISPIMKDAYKSSETDQRMKLYTDKKENQIPQNRKMLADLQDEYIHTLPPSMESISPRSVSDVPEHIETGFPKNSISDNSAYKEQMVLEEKKSIFNLKGFLGKKTNDK